MLFTRSTASSRRGILTVQGRPRAVCQPNSGVFSPSVDASYTFYAPQAGAGPYFWTLAVPKIAYRLGAPSDFDRCAILTSLHPPLAALR